VDIKQVSDEELMRLAEEEGPTSSAAAILHRLRVKRAKDYQVFAWQAGDYYFVGPVPDARTECLIMKFLEEADEDE
jgi:hypothetical protein